MEGKMRIIFCLFLVGCLSNQALAKPKSSRPVDSTEDDYPNDYGVPEDYNDSEGESEPEVTDGKPRHPPILITKGGPVRTMMGKPLSLECGIENNGWIVFWKKASQAGTISIDGVSNNAHYQIKTPNILFIQNTDESDNDVFTCEVRYDKDGVEQSITSEHSVTLDSPAKVTGIKPSSKLVDENSQVQIECKISGHPKPNVEWYKMGAHSKNVRITDKLAAEWGIVIDYNILNITKVNHHHHSGKYHCLADNKIVEDNRLGHSNYSQIIVLHKPDVLVQSHAYNAEEGHDVDIHCTVVSNPDAKQGWFYKDQIQPLRTDDIENNHKIEVRTTKDKDDVYKKHIELKIKNATKNDLGKYICKAENKFGDSIRVVEVGPKPSIHNIQSSSVDKAPYELNFKVRSIAPLNVVEISFAREKEAFDKWTKLPIDSPTGVEYNFSKNITGLQKGIYVGRIVAQNSHGRTEMRVPKFVVDEDDNTPIKVAGALGTNASGAISCSLFTVVLLYLISKSLH